MTKFFTIKSRSKYLKHLGFLLLMFAFSLNANAQSSVSGNVSDANGPIPGANVVVKGTTNGVGTDADGNYTITNVPANGVLVISFIGYNDKEMPVQGKSRIDVVLEESTSTLEEVVVIGYGTQRKEAVTGSVASISGAAMRDIPSGNITQALQGRLAGIEFAQTSSKPGAAMQIRVRGTRSLTGSNDPLIVLDGIPFAGSISDINPVDIKSIDVLKDASATAIYGSRGANGVVLVTTNKGQKGEKATFTYNSYYSIKEVFAEFPMMNGPQLVELRKASGLYPVNGLDESDDVDTDWQGNFYRTAIMTSHDVAIAGGTKNGSYNFGIGYFLDEAVIPGQNYDRFSLRSALDQEIGAFKFGLNSNNNYSVARGGNMGMFGVLSASPIANPFNEDGSTKRVIESAADQQWVYTRNTVENLGSAWVDESRSFASYNNLFAEVKIPGIEGLKYRTNVGLNFRMNNSGSYTGEGVFSPTPDNVSRAAISNSLTTQWVIENLLTYDRTFADKHKINLIGMFSAEDNSFNRSVVSATDIARDEFRFYNLGQTTEPIVVDPAQQIYQKSGLRSYMARAMYSYDDRYMLTATLRRDGSSRLADGNKWHTYPALSAGWNITNESFLENNKSINLLKLRVGYGETSNQAVNPYATLGSLGLRPYNFGDQNAMGYYVQELPGPDLGWEYSQTKNYGLDFAFFNNRLSGTAEYYVTKTTDLLMRIGLPPTSGASGYIANAGNSMNKGIEFSLNGVILDNPNGLSWEMGVNIYSNKNELTSLASGQDRDEANWWFVGQPINVIYDYQKEGLWQEGDPYLDILEPGGNPGMIKVKYTGEYNADGTPVRQIGPDDRQVIKMDPDFQGGFNTRFTYKGFDLGIVGSFQSGGVLISTLHSANGYLNLLNGRRGNVDVDYWTPENTDAKYPKPGGLTSGDNPKYGTTMGYFDASYMKVRTITLGYDFKQSFIQDLGLERFRLYATVTNPLVLFSPFHKETGMDPETNSYGNENAAVTETYRPRLLTIGTNTPATSSFLVGFNLTF
ncbi:TonB-linked SusC/RagA family outer membrane protein [Flavobacterium arsenatis]|uniref:TonB-linked SusC/RagA family outer membrane protein n=1 Tax=Flavobacterium arsenatis TaxID=1484332 RepID=A0ABU1TRN8_9FLAO|nr:TonB-dependent receptor [Flavobacterium arsenatis]MDR6968517.1 TonB-linked SusC/RagA family outer membrane protein [Flavobacterium arsenatis]